jgi:NAD(P)-dependent dehydrogenase (short-subunit alcohol dehydrogenase family)
MAALFDLTGTVALVTGGNSGIGLGMATALAQHGADVAIWGTNESKNAPLRSFFDDSVAGCRLGSVTSVTGMQSRPSWQPLWPISAASTAVS